MPWLSEAMKDVISCDKLWGVAQTLWSADFRMGQPDILKIFILQTSVIQYMFVIIDTLQSINYIYNIYVDLYEQYYNKYNFKEK